KQNLRRLPIDSVGFLNAPALQEIPERKGVGVFFEPRRSAEFRRINLTSLEEIIRKAQGLRACHPQLDPLAEFVRGSERGGGQNDCQENRSPQPRSWQGLVGERDFGHSWALLRRAAREA